MKPYYEDATCTIYHGDCREVLPLIEPVESVVTDPPYGLAFMGKAWDHAVPDSEYWRAVMAATRPGGTLLAFGGTRLWHWLAVGIEQAGWEIRDTLMWLYGSGFPKSLDISKAIDKAAGAEREIIGVNEDYLRRKPNGMKTAGATAYRYSESQHETDARITAPATDAAKLWNGWGTALKPAWEPVILAMKPLDGTFAENALRHGVAGLNVDGARIAHNEECRPIKAQDVNKRADRTIRQAIRNKDTTELKPAGRWPANLILDGDSAALLDEQSGELPAGIAHEPDGTPKSHRIYSPQNNLGRTLGYGDTGGASRFFYNAKASRSERGEFNDHPTVKPLDLMGYLCRLTATPTGGTVLDPFMGSGSTLIAAMREGRKAIGIELDEAHCEIAVKRIATENLNLFGAQ